MLSLRDPKTLDPVTWEFMKNVYNILLVASIAVAAGAYFHYLTNFHIKYGLLGAIGSFLIDMYLLFTWDTEGTNQRLRFQYFLVFSVLLGLAIKWMLGDEWPDNPNPLVLTYSVLSSVVTFATFTYFSFQVQEVNRDSVQFQVGIITLLLTLINVVLLLVNLFKNSFGLTMTQVVIRIIIWSMLVFSINIYTFSIHEKGKGNKDAVQAAMHFLMNTFCLFVDFVRFYSAIDGPPPTTPTPPKEKEPTTKDSSEGT